MKVKKDRFRSLLFGTPIALAMAMPAGARQPSSGQDLAFARDKGNCLACHVMEGGTQMGDIGPPLENMRSRFPDRKRLVEQIYDAGQFNEQTLMPPFGRHKILSAEEIGAIVEYLYTL